MMGIQHEWYPSQLVLSTGSVVCMRKEEEACFFGEHLKLNFGLIKPTYLD